MKNDKQEKKKKKRNEKQEERTLTADRIFFIVIIIVIIVIIVVNSVGVVVIGKGVFFLLVDVVGFSFNSSKSKEMGSQRSCWSFGVFVMGICLRRRC